MPSGYRLSAGMLTRSFPGYGAMLCGEQSAQPSIEKQKISILWGREDAPILQIAYRRERDL